MPRRIAPAADLLAVTILSIPAWRFLAAPGFLGGHDSLFHLFRLVELDGAIRSGVLYPRLAPNLALGYDYPAFNYYAPLFGYVAEAFRLAGLSYFAAVKAALALSVVAAGWTMLLFARSFLPRVGALVAALAYVYLPYLLADAYVRGASAEALALALLPLCLWTFGRLAEHPHAGSIAAAGLALATLVLAHNVTTVFFAPLLGAYWLFALLDGGRARQAKGLWRRTLAAGGAVALGLALSAFYWAPAFLERDLVASGRLTESWFDFHNHFQPISRFVQTSLAYGYGAFYVDPKLGWRELFPVGLVQLALGVLGCVVAVLWRGRRRPGLFWGAALAASLALQTSRSAPVWEAIPLAAYIQFPWRLQALAGLAGAVLAGLLAATLWDIAGRTWLAWGAAAVVTAGLAASAVAGLDPALLSVRDETAQPWLIQRYDLDRKLIAATRGEYVPRGVTADLFDPGELPPDDGAGRGLQLTVREAGPFHLELDFTAEQPARVLLDRFYFPGWQARVDGASAPTRPFGPLALLATDVPAGEHHLSVWFGDTPVRSAGEATSIAGLLALAGLAAWPALRRATGVRADHLPRTPAGSPPSTARALAGGAATLALALVLGARAIGAGLPPAGSSPALLAPEGAGFGPAVRLAGAQLDRVGQATVDLTLYWQARERPGRDYAVALRLLDSAGRVVGERNKRPLYGLRPTALWEAGELVRDHQAVAVRPGTPAGEYELVAGLVDRQTGDYLPPAEGAVAWRDGADSGVGTRLGRVRVPGNPADGSPPLARLSGARFGDAVVLESYELRAASTDRTAPAGEGGYAAVVGQGDRLQIRLRWQALRDLDDDYAVFAHLLDSRQQMVAQGDDWPQSGFYPTTLWLPGERIADGYEIAVPPTLAPGRYEVSVGLYRRSDKQRLPVAGGAGADRLTLGAIKVASQPPIAADSLPVRRRVDASLGGEVTLLGYDLAALDAAGQRRPDLALQPGDSLAVTLYWQADRRPAQDYTVFVHLYGGDGPPRAQDDGRPAAGNYPTTLWEPGEVVPDRRVVALPPDAPAGRYRLAVGMYQLQTGARLKLPTGGDLVTLEEVVVGRPSGG